MTASSHSIPSDPDSTDGIDDLRPFIESALDTACGFEPGCPSKLSEAIRYAVLAPGKRLRPALVLMAAEACGGRLEDAMPGAVAVEMIHAYSLIHDDLPAMDDDDLRRGRPTVHIKFDEAMAILAGDALQAEAFAHLIRNIPDPIKAAESVGVLAAAAGASRLVGGQADDLSAEQDADQGPQNRTLDHLESIHRRKTGALFAASLDLGAILAGSEKASRAVLAQFASDIGLAFQVVDDLLDHTADEQSLGKRTGKDSIRGKLTYPALMGIEGARQRAQDLVESAKNHAMFFGPAGWRLLWLADYITERTV